MSFLSKLFARKRNPEHLNLCIRSGDTLLIVPMPLWLQGELARGSYVASVITDEESARLERGDKLLVSFSHSSINCHKRFKGEELKISHRFVAAPARVNNYLQTPPLQTPYPHMGALPPASSV